MNEQLDLFGFAPSQYIIKKPIRLIELFAGIGAQSKALEVLKANFENYKIAEWSKESIKAYTYIHHYEEIKNCDDKEITNLEGISRNYNEPMTKEQINNLKDDEKILLTNCKNIAHNLIDISKVKGEDLNIVDTDKYEYIMTFSFPCQDLSLSGKLGGMEEGSGTRSSLLWEVVRLLKECKEKGNLPNILLMENVPQVIGTKNKSSFHKLMKKLEDFGYKNFVKVLNSKDFYIPQNRQRCFMVSILTKEDVFSFPNKMKLDYYLSDFLDKEVDEKYYLSDKKIIQIQNWKGFENPLKDILPNRIVSTLTTHCGKDSNGMQLVLIPENTKKGYAEAKVGDGIYINRPEQKRGVVQKGMIQTIKTSCDDIGVVVDDNKYLGTYEYSKSNNFMKNKSRFEPDKKVSNTLLASGNNNGIVVLGNYSPSNHNASRIVDSKGIAPKVIGGIGEKKSNNGTQWFLQDRIYDNNIATAICTSFNPYYLTKHLRIRKLTPCECYKLMGFTQRDYKRCAEIQSNATIYHQAGDSIVVTVLIAIFGKLLGIDYEEIIKKYVKGEILNESKYNI